MDSQCEVTTSRLSVTTEPGDTDDHDHAAERDRDSHGNPMTGDAATIERYDRAIDRLAALPPCGVDLATELAGEDSPAPMAHALIAYLHLMSTDAADLATAATRTRRSSPPTATTASRRTPAPSAPG